MDNQEIKSPFKTVYGNISGLLAAIGLLSIAESFLSIKNFFIHLVDAWREIVHPISTLIFEKVLFFVNFPIPDYAIDYLTIGVIVATSSLRRNLEFIRLHFAYTFASSVGIKNTYDIPAPIDLRIIIISIPLFILDTLAWPITIIFSSIFIFINLRTKSDIYWEYCMKRIAFVTLSPYIYFAFILLANYGLFFLE